MSPELGKGRSAQRAELPEALNELEPDGAVQESEELLSIIDFYTSVSIGIHEIIDSIP